MQPGGGVGYSPTVGILDEGSSTKALVGAPGIRQQPLTAGDGNVDVSVEFGTVDEKCHLGRVLDRARDGAVPVTGNLCCACDEGVELFGLALIVGGDIDGVVQLEVVQFARCVGCGDLVGTHSHLEAVRLCVSTDDSVDIDG